MGLLLTKNNGPPVVNGKAKVARPEGARCELAYSLVPMSHTATAIVGWGGWAEEMSNWYGDRTKKIT